MFCCPYCGKSLTTQGTTVVSCCCEESVEEERRSRQERMNFKRQQSPDLSKRKRSNYRKE